jgi:hypothetical protein
MPRKEPRPEDAFDFAIERGSIADAWFFAHQMHRVATFRALRLTIAVGCEGGPKYPRLARAFLRRFIYESAPSLSLIELTAYALKLLGDEKEDKTTRADARDGLMKLARHLERGEPEQWDGNVGPQF